MSTGPHRSSGGGAAFSDDDIVWLYILAVMSAPILLALVPSWRDTAAHWLVEHRVLIDATATDALWTLPGDIAGLDLRRLVLTGLIVAAAAVVVAVRLVARHHRRVQKQLVTGDQP